LCLGFRVVEWNYVDLKAGEEAKYSDAVVVIVGLRVGMNPNYLFKDELNYELRVRRIKSNADRKDLRKLFPLLVVEDVVVETPYLCERGFDNRYQVAITIFISKVTICITSFTFNHCTFTRHGYFFAQV
jgi:hypothetical protein